MNVVGTQLPHIFVGIPNMQSNVIRMKEELVEDGTAKNAHSTQAKERQESVLYRDRSIYKSSLHE